MEFWSSVGSFISSVGSGISSFVRGAAGCVGGIVKGATKVLCSLGGSIGQLASKASGLLGGITEALNKVLSPVLGPLAPIVTSIVVDVLTNVLINVLTPKGEDQMQPEEVEEYGALLKESENHPEWKGAEAFNNGLEHLTYLKTQAAQANIDIPKAKKLSIESLNRRTLGMAALWDRLEKQEQLEISSQFLVYAGLKGFDSEQLRAVLDTTKSLGYNYVPYMEFTSGKMSLEDQERFNNEMVKHLRELKDEVGDSLSIAEAYEMSNTMQEPVNETSLLKTIQYDINRYEELGNELYNVDDVKSEYKKYDMTEEIEKIRSI